MKVIKVVQLSEDHLKEAVKQYLRNPPYNSKFDDIAIFVDSEEELYEIELLEDES